MIRVAIEHVCDSAARFSRREDGTTMVEFAICISLFLLILFAILDFARLGYTWVSAEKVVQIAARTAAVRYPVCANVPFSHQRAVGTTPDVYPSGTSCRQDGGVCLQTDPEICTLADGLALDGTTTGDAPLRFEAASQILARIEPLLPSNIEPENIQISYAYDRNLGFIGGPYVPLITVEMVAVDGQPSCAGEVCFTFVTPLSALAATAGSAATGVPNEGGTIPFPAISASVPAEDMNKGMDG